MSTQSTRVFCLVETSVKSAKELICFQEAVYKYPADKSDVRYRFIRKDEKGRLKAQRGQCGIDDLSQALELVLEMARMKNYKFSSKHLTALTAITGK
jgi:aspartyl-tRNA synthetase